MKTYKFEVVINCQNNNVADLNRVSSVIEHTLQPLIDDSYFVHALNEEQPITLSVNVIE